MPLHAAEKCSFPNEIFLFILTFFDELLFFAMFTQWISWVSVSPEIKESIRLSVLEESLSASADIPEEKNKKNINVPTGRETVKI